MIGKCLDQIKTVKIKVYTKSDYQKVFSKSETDPLRKLSKIDLVYIMLHLIEQQHSPSDYIPVSSRYPGAVEYFSLHMETKYNNYHDS